MSMGLFVASASKGPAKCGSPSNNILLPSLLYGHVVERILHVEDKKCYLYGKVACSVVDGRCRDVEVKRQDGVFRDCVTFRPAITCPHPLTYLAVLTPTQ
jgi:hypothetical protein